MHTLSSPRINPGASRELLGDTETGGNGYFAAGRWDGGIDDEHTAHILRWQPARVLALTAALRSLLDNFSHDGAETAAILTLGAALYGDLDEQPPR